MPRTGPQGRTSDDTQNLETHGRYLPWHTRLPLERYGPNKSRCCQRARPGQPRPGMEPDLHRHPHRHEHPKLFQSPACRDRAHSDVRCVQRHRQALYASPGSWASSARCITPSGRHRRRVHGTDRPVPIQAIGVGCQLHSVARNAERRWRGWRPIAGARGRLGNGGRASRAGLARERWFQHHLPGVRGWHGGRPVAAGGAGDVDERPGSGIRGHVRPREQ